MKLAWSVRLPRSVSTTMKKLPRCVSTTSFLFLRCLHFLAQLHNRVVSLWALQFLDVDVSEADEGAIILKSDMSAEFSVADKVIHKLAVQTNEVALSHAGNFH